MTDPALSYIHQTFLLLRFFTHSRRKKVGKVEGEDVLSDLWEITSEGKEASVGQQQVSGMQLRTTASEHQEMNKLEFALPFACQAVSQSRLSDFPGPCLCVSPHLESQSRKWGLLLSRTPFPLRFNNKSTSKLKLQWEGTCKHQHHLSVT